MILKRTGVGEFRELTDEEVQALLQKTIGKTKSELKRNLEFLLIGKKGVVAGKQQMTYPTSKSILHQFTTREDNSTVTYAYCHRVETVRDGGVIEQKLMSATGEPWPQKLGIQFRRTKKKIICSPSELDKAIYMAIYPECDVSPFRGNNPYNYELVKKEERAKRDIKSAKEVVALQNQILNVMDIATLRAYVAAAGNKESHLLEDDEIRAIVFQDATKDPEKFKLRINSSSMTLRADVNSFVQDGLVVIKAFQADKFWQVAKGEMKGELLAKIPNGASDEIKPLVTFFFDNPREFDQLKYEYLKSAGNRPVVKQVETLGEGAALSRVEGYYADGLIMYLAPQRKVLLANPETGKKRTGSAELCPVQPGQDWKTALAIAIEADPSLEQMIPL